MTFYEKFIKLCSELSIAPSAAAQQAGISRTSVTRWKNGAIPSDAIVYSLAQVLGVSFEVLRNDNLSLDETDNKEIKDVSDEELKKTLEIALFNGEKGITDEQLSDIKKVAKLMILKDDLPNEYL